MMLYAIRETLSIQFWRMAFSIMLLVSCVYAIDPRYHTYGEMTDEMITAAQTYPGICRLDTIGYTSFYQLPILAMKISDNPDLNEDEPCFLFNGVHHGCELIGVEVCLYMMHDLLSRYDTSQKVRAWIDSNEIWLVPMVNPDGHYITFNIVQDSWRKNARDNNGNGQFDSLYDGVDLNRNYDFNWENGDPNPPSREYRGAFPFSENETRAIRDLAVHNKFVFDICYHSDKNSTLGESVYFPWRWGNPYSPDRYHIEEVAESVAYRIINDLGSSPYVPIWGDAVDGGLARNWFYHALGTFSFTIEVSTCYQPPGYRVDTLCQKVTFGSYYLFKRILGPGITGHIIDSATSQPIVAEVRILQAYSSPDTIAPRYSDSLFGRYRRILKTGYYTLQVLAPGYQAVQIESVQVQAQGPTNLDIRLPRNQSISENELQKKSGEFNLSVMPNFIKGNPNIKWQITERSRVNLRIYDNMGKKVSTIFDKIFDPGIYYINWNGKDKQGNRVSSGIYFLRLENSSQAVVQKIVLSN